MKRVFAMGTVLGVLAIANAAGATNNMIGADAGHDNPWGNFPSFSACDATKLSFTTAVACNNVNSPSATYNWQVPLPSPVASGVVTLAATATAFVPAGSNANQKITGRLIGWDNVSTLLCFTPVVTWLPVGGSQSKSLGSCNSFSPFALHVEAEFGLGHVQGQNLNADPRLFAVQYTY